MKVSLVLTVLDTNELYLFLLLVLEKVGATKVKGP